MSIAESSDDDLAEIDYLPNIRNIPGREQHAVQRLGFGGQKQRPGAAPRGRPSEAGPELAVQDDTIDSFDFSYHASRHERVWIVDSLGGFYEGQWLEDVLRLIKGGKEANVYQCLAHPSVVGLDNPYIAAKVYRPRQFRNLKNDHQYREGRPNLDSAGRLVTNDGMLHAMAKRTDYGLELLHASWIAHEYKTLQVLFEAGLDVPRPLATANKADQDDHKPQPTASNAILMSYIGDEELPAPTLNSVSLGRKEAQRLFERVLFNIEGMLSRRRIHADLSAYNILYWEGEITLIDFPQAIEPEANRNAFPIFERDVIRVCEYFARQGVKANPRQLAAGLWKAHHYHQIPDVHPGLLDPDDEKDQAYWRTWVGADGV
jgi:RIO kinase 1